MKFSRFFAVIICIFILFSLLGCGKIKIGPLLDKLPLDEIDIESLLPENIISKPTIKDDAANEVVEVFEEDSIPLFDAEPEVTYVVTETVTEAITEVVTEVVTEAVTEAITEVVITEFVEETTKVTDGTGCNHLHVQEAQDLFVVFVNLFDDPQGENKSNQGYCATHRLVVAYGGLRLRETPVDGTQVGLILDGDIIHILDHKDGWAYTCYDGVYGWCSMEYLFDPYIYPTAGGAPIAKAKALRSGIKLVTNRRCDDKDEVSTTIPRSTTLLVYGLESGTAFVQYKNIYGYCSTEDLEIKEWTEDDALNGHLYYQW